MKLPQLRKLNAQGFSHAIILAVFVVVFTIAGIGYTVASHAQTPEHNVLNSSLSSATQNALLKSPITVKPEAFDACKPHASLSCQSKVYTAAICSIIGNNPCASPPPASCSGANPPAPCSNIKTVAAAKKIANNRAVGIVNNLIRRGKDSSLLDVAKAPSTSGSTETTTSAGTVNSGTPAPQPDPRGNIVVVTKLNGPLYNGAQQPPTKAGRLGLVGVTIAREGGNEVCTTHSTLSAKTNAITTATYTNIKADIYGTVHFANCAAGKYTVTNTGRNYYKVDGSNTAHVTLSNNEVQYVYFTMEHPLR